MISKQGSLQDSLFFLIRTQIALFLLRIGCSHSTPWLPNVLCYKKVLVLVSPSPFRHSLILSCSNKAKKKSSLNLESDFVYFIYFFSHLICDILLGFLIKLSTFYVCLKMLLRTICAILKLLRLDDQCVSNVLNEYFGSSNQLFYGYYDDCTPIKTFLLRRSI